MLLKCSSYNDDVVEIAFLGHIVSTDGVAADPSKTDVVSKWPTPQSRKEVQQFLGIGNYYRRFVKNFASILQPLQRLTERMFLSNGLLDAKMHLRNCVNVWFLPHSSLPRL